LDDFVGDDHNDDEINEARQPLREGVELARAFFLIMRVKAFQRFIEFAADFAAGVKIGEHFGKFAALAQDLGGRVAGDNFRFPTFHGAAQRGRAARGRRQIPCFNDVHARIDERFQRGGEPREREKTPRGSENWNWPHQRFDERAPFFAVLALRGVNQKKRDEIKRRKNERGFCEKKNDARVELRSGERKHDQKNERGEMHQPDGINELRNHLLREAGAVVVIFGEQAKGSVEASAAFAGFNQRDVKFRQPRAEFLQRLAEGKTLREMVQQIAKRFAERTSGRIAFDLFERGQDADAGGSELRELMIQFGALGELRGRDEKRHNAPAGLKPRRGRGWP
jgi:hypothetical protein